MRYIKWAFTAIAVLFALALFFAPLEETQPEPKPEKTTTPQGAKKTGVVDFGDFESNKRPYRRSPGNPRGDD